jgi:excisionase family DNA binding protein
MTMCEAAMALGVSPSMAYKAAADGTLPVLRIGRRVLVLREGLQRLLTAPHLVTKQP